MQDTIAVVVDSAQAVADTAKVVTDSVLATQVGTQVGVVATTVALAILGVVSKVVTSGAALITPQWDKLPDAVKAVVALVFAQIVVWVNAKLGLALSPDITVAQTTVVGLVTWVLAMGWHRLSKFVVAKTPVA